MRSLILYPEELGMVSNRVVELIEPAIEAVAGDLTIAHILSGLYRGELAAWVAIEDQKIIAAAIYRIDDWRDGKRVNILALGSDKNTYRKWRDQFIGDFRSIANHFECKGIIAHGRKGYDRFFGAKPIYTAYELEV